MWVNGVIWFLIFGLGVIEYLITPSLCVRNKIEKCTIVVKNERTGITNARNWTDENNRPRGIEIGCFFGLFTTRICRFSSPFLKIAFFSSYTSKNRRFSGSISGTTGWAGLGRVGSGRLLTKMWKNGRAIWAETLHKTINLSNFEMVE